MSNESELASLCTSCGLCCDGTLFRRALLLPEEVESARKNRLDVIENGKGFQQPCPRLENLSCGIYADRPSVCRSFTCKLLERYRNEGGPLEPRVRKVRRVRTLLAVLNKSGLHRTEEGDVRFEAQGVDAVAAMAAFGELMVLLEEDFARHTSAPT